MGGQSRQQKTITKKVRNMNRTMTLGFAGAVIISAAAVLPRNIVRAEDGVFMTAAGLPAESEPKPFMGEPQCETQKVFNDERLPNVVVATDGTVVLVWGWGEVRVRRSEDGGENWGSEIKIRSGLNSGGTIVDEKTGDILLFTEEKHPPAPLHVYRSADHGETWIEQQAVIHPDENGNVPSMCMNEHGITLRHGKHQGRLLRPARYYGMKNSREEWPNHYTTAIYSEDGGVTWQTSDPFPENGTGEATVAELSDGTIYYNTRRHWAPKGKNPRRRWTARSHDGGKTWTDVSICEALPDGAQYRDYGLMAGLVRLPVKGQDILVFSNIESQKGRKNGVLWVSFDGGRTWPLKRGVYEGSFAYSSLSAGRPGTPSEGWIYFAFESEGGCRIARCNLAWLLEGEPTGDGKVPRPYRQLTGSIPYSWQNVRSS